MPLLPLIRNAHNTEISELQKQENKQLSSPATTLIALWTGLYRGFIHRANALSFLMFKAEIV